MSQAQPTNQEMALQSLMNLADLLTEYIGDTTGEKSKQSQAIIESVSRRFSLIRQYIENSTEKGPPEAVAMPAALKAGDPMPKEEEE